MVDETGFLRKGTKSVGVQRQYSGTAGRIENSQVGVFLTYATAQGRSLLDQELYLPQVWADDEERRREAGVPEAATFQTKPQLALGMLERAVESGVPFSWVTEDAVYGSDRNLRLWLERAEIPHVLAIKSNEKLWALTDKGPRQVRADQLASGVAESDWSRCSAGDGAKGPPGLRLDHGGDTAPEGAWEGVLAAGPPQRCQARGTGLLRVLRGGGDDSGRLGAGGGNPVGHLGVL